MSLFNAFLGNYEHETALTFSVSLAFKLFKSLDMFFDHSKVNFTIGLNQQIARIKERLTV